MSEKESVTQPMLVAIVGTTFISLLFVLGLVFFVI
jgi:hypothetical protein